MKLPIKGTAIIIKNRISHYSKGIIEIISYNGIWNLPKSLFDYRAIKRILNEKVAIIADKYRIDNPDISYHKYLDINYWLFENMRRFYALGLHEEKNKLEILDIGTGTGYFPFVCKYFGHEAEALDIPNNDMYNDIIKELGIKRYDRFILPFNLIKIEKRYDLITSYMICFNCHKQPNLWHIPEWEYFLNSLYKNNLNPGGEVFLSFNTEKTEEPVSDELLAYFSKTMLLLMAIQFT